MEGTTLEEDLKILGSDSIRQSCEHFIIDMGTLDNKAAEEEEYTQDAVELDRVYNDMREIRSAAIEYGRREKFAVSTLRSGARQLVLACKHSGSYRGTKKTVVVEEEPSQQANTLPTVVLQQQENDLGQVELFPRKLTRRKVSRKIQCPFQIRAKPIKGGQWIVYKMVLEHNHPMATDSKAYAQHRKLDDNTQKEIVRLMRDNKTNSQIVKYLSDNGIKNVVRKDIANLRQTYFNPNSNKLSATGNILYQVEPPLEKTSLIAEPRGLEAQKLEAQQVAEVTEAFNLFQKSNVNGVAQNQI